ncbi:hypothetical protein LCGC14_3030730 [marine sediment metagenome]|uniref:Uncharacterized protein n=1 Tax=marine sediment metagenome TaxID=412755 RepID=A0A0F8XFN9_9ZZZZ
MITRRELIAMLGAGAIMTAEGLYWPGTKLISISPRQVFLNHDEISLVAADTGRVICSVLRGAEAVDICGGVATIRFPLINPGVQGLITSMYVGKANMFEFSVPLVASPNMIVTATIGAKDHQLEALMSALR